MLSKIDNELVTRVGPGTPMGDLMRQYWVPAMISTELPEPDCAPVRVKLLGEELIAFRDSSARVGMISNSCPHRGASLFFGRNEEGGLRCVYHGWKFDVTGACVDMPSEPAESNFKQKIKATAYPCQERRGVVWAYMGPREAPPPLPDLEPNMVADGKASVSAFQRECNWLQALEGDIDTSHLGFLHYGHAAPDSAQPGTFQYHLIADRAPRYQVVDIPGGTMYGAYRPGPKDTYYWRIAHFLFPFYTLIPTGLLGYEVRVRCWVPMDDEHTMYMAMSKRQSGLGATGGPRAPTAGTAARGMDTLPNSTHWYGRFRLVANRANDYLIDREQQRTNESFTGIAAIHVQDQAITESMGRIYDRSTERLGSSDAMVIRTRHRLIEAARALREQRITPPGVDDPTAYHERSGGVFLPRGADWIEATRDLRKAFVDHPELNPAIVG